MCKTNENDKAFTIEFFESAKKKTKMCKLYHWDSGSKHEVKIGEKHLVGFMQKDGNYGVYKVLPNNDSIDISDC